MAEPLDLGAVSERRAKAEAWYEGVHYGLKLYAASSDDVPALVAEVKRLRALLRDVDLYGQAFVYSPAGREPLVLHPADVTVHMRADAVTAHEAALKVVHAAEAFSDACADVGAADLFDATGALHAAVGEWRASCSGE